MLDLFCRLSTIDIHYVVVEYARGADPTLLCTGDINEKPESAIIALTPDGKTVAVATENNIAIYNGVTQQLDVEIKGIFSSMFFLN